jgi:hyperosmotically inducible periplasmic protein
MLGESNDARILRSTRSKTASMRRIAIWLTFVPLLFAVAALSLPAQTAPANKPPKSEDKFPSSLSREIHHQILVLPFYSVFDSISFTLQGNRVTLTGQVLRHSLKENAEAAVKSIEGVDIVVDQIEILPSSPSDDDLRRAVYRALYEDPALAHYAIQNVPPVHIIVKNGGVALEGSVDSASDKNLAATRAGSVANVLSVKNNLVVHPKDSAAE